MEVVLIEKEISMDNLKRMALESFGDMVKAVVDIEKGIMAVGGELHADAEVVLLKNGSKQEDLWGINIYPELSIDNAIEFSSLINIKPLQGNRSMDIKDEYIKERIKRIFNKLVKINDQL